jgi:hypothetical protein
MENIKNTTVILYGIPSIIDRNCVLRLNSSSSVEYNPSEVLTYLHFSASSLAEEFTNMVNTSTPIAITGIVGAGVVPSDLGYFHHEETPILTLSKINSITKIKNLPDTHNAKVSKLDTFVTIHVEEIYEACGSFYHKSIKGEVYPCISSSPDIIVKEYKTPWSND